MTMMMMPFRSSGAERQLLLLVGRFPVRHLAQSAVRPPLYSKASSNYHTQELQSPLLLQLGGSRSFSSGTTDDSNSNILQAEVVRKRPTSSSRVVLRQAQEELSALEQSLQAALTRHERLVAANANNNDDD